MAKIGTLNEYAGAITFVKEQVEKGAVTEEGKAGYLIGILRNKKILPPKQGATTVQPSRVLTTEEKLKEIEKLAFKVTAETVKKHVQERQYG